MPDPAIKSQNPKHLRLHSAAIFYFLSRLAMVAFVFSVPAIYFLRGQVEIPLVIGGAGLVMVLLLSYYLAATGLRCAACISPVLMENGCRKHPGARRFAGLSHRARVAWDILFHTSYQCMYCHTRCRCKKRWNGAGSKLDRLNSAEMATEEGVRHSPFSGVQGLTEEIFDAGPVADDDEGLLFGESRRSKAAPGFDAAAGGSNLPASAQGSIPGRETDEQSVRIAAMSPLEQMAPAPPPESGAPKPILPVPWTVPLPAKTPDKETVMNRPSTETYQAPQAPNPFLAAAAAMPPPPGPVLPAMQKSVPVQVEPRAVEPPPFRQEFPFSGAEPPESGRPTPWTLPSMPAPALPASPAMIPSAAPVAVRTPGVRQDAALPSGLVEDVISTLEDGRRALTDAFQSLIGKLEAAMAVPRPAPVVPAPAPLPAVAPVREPVISSPVELPSLLARPEPPITPPQMTAVETLPPAARTRPLPVLPPPPAIMMPDPAPPVTEERAPVAPRRKFSRPSGLAAQQLSTALQQVFETAPPAPNGNGNGSSSPSSAPPAAVPPRAPVETITPVPPPVPRVQAPQPDSIHSPFAVSSAPLSSPHGMPGEPVPFTFLTNHAGHFEPAPGPEPAGTYDPLDDTTLPWMQPLGGSAIRR